MDPHAPRAGRLGRVSTPGLPLSGCHLLSLGPVVTHCSSERVLGTGMLARLGSTLRQYSVSQNSSLMVNSVLFSTTVICNKQHGLEPGSPQLLLPSLLLLCCALGKSPGCVVIMMTAARSKIPPRAGKLCHKTRREASPCGCGCDKAQHLLLRTTLLERSVFPLEQRPDGDSTGTATPLTVWLSRVLRRCTW